MGFGGISIWQLLIVLVIVLLLFGTKKVRNMGSDLGAAIRGFRKSVKDVESGEQGEEDKEGVPGQLEEQAESEAHMESDEAATHKDKA